MNDPKRRFHTVEQALAMIFQAVDQWNSVDDLFMLFNLLHIACLEHAKVIEADHHEAVQSGDHKRSRDARHFAHVYKKLAFGFLALKFLAGSSDANISASEFFAGLFRSLQENADADSQSTH